MRRTAKLFAHATDLLHNIANCQARSPQDYVLNRRFIERQISDPSTGDQIVFEGQGAL